jgi:hypothetical protein
LLAIGTSVEGIVLKDGAGTLQQDSSSARLPLCGTSKCADWVSLPIFDRYALDRLDPWLWIGSSPLRTDRPDVRVLNTAKRGKATLVQVGS